ncbi:DUF4296 domain-containing protein [Flavobacterium hibernum]|uniref:DUF4296 domain-containing protein n=1 Tax=Flavobacterium hibernum TaxID=37752 RepID=A0A0D0EU01_9FLAO|nr:DUF4296 domain-containing protein [Flavobacterium hibernum]KIO52208.1 hypothetical protein IW18_13865 [Flavobacterium hibernum]OXA87054.1 hypothetical protein B0A73_12115 [Flavobacterium hibernum]STO14091.1 Uncharacterised protein [Flavobacterium hibernum]
MKNWIVIVLVLFLSVSCKKELVKQPAKLIEKEKMIDIMYDLSLLEAMKYQNPASIDSSETNATKFILKKYKVDSLQFAQSNMYYAADYDNYKDMFDQIGKRLAVEQRAVDSIVKIEEKKALKLKAKEKKVVNKDFLKAVMKQVNVDSIRKIIQSKK